MIRVHWPHNTFKNTTFECRNCNVSDWIWMQSNQTQLINRSRCCDNETPWVLFFYLSKTSVTCMGPSSQRGAWSKAGTMRFFKVEFSIFFLKNPIILGPAKSGFILIEIMLFALKRNTQCIGREKSWVFPTLDDNCRLEYIWQQLE